MAQESAYVPAPYNGISQSASQVRLQEQAADLQDCIVDLPDGFRKRSPLCWLGEMRPATSGANADARVHKIVDPDDGTIKFLLMCRESTITHAYLYEASDLSPVALNVDAGAQTYLSGAVNPMKSTLRISQAVDYTILTSRYTTVTVDASLNATRPHEALVFVKSGAYGKKYQVTITKSGGTPRVGAVVTPSGDDANDSFWVDTDKIIQGIFANNYAYTDNGAGHTGIQTELASDGFTVTTKGGVAYISHTSDFTVQVQDSQGGVAMIAVKDTVNNFSDLPKDAVTDGFTVSVVPTRGDKQGAYYVKFLTNPPRGESPWQETVGPGSQKGFDTTTMPVAVFKDSSGNWQLDALAWKQRAVGDQTLAIDPLFVGDTIQDIGYSFGRLIIVSAEECFLTAADDPFRIYPATLTTQIDSDPISLSPPNGDAKFRAITSYSSNILEGAFLSGLQQQCVLRAPGDGPITPTAAKLARISKYELKEAFSDLRPLFNNGKVYMPVPLGTLYSGLREMKVDRQSGESLGDDLTAAQPKYLPQGLNVGATCETTFLAMYGVAGTSKIYTHLFRYNDNQRVQNGLFTWNLPAGWLLVDIVNDGTMFYFFLLSGDRLCVFTMETNPQTLDDGAPTGEATIFTKLDLRQREDQVVSRTYNSGQDVTTIVSQVDLPIGAGYVAARETGDSHGSYPEGYLAEVVSQGSNYIVVKGDWTNAQGFYFGLGYVGLWTPSTINKYSPQDSRIMHGVLTVDRIRFDLKDASGLTVQVANGGRTVRSYDLKQIVFGSPTLYTGEFIVPVKGRNKQVTVHIRDEGHIGSTVSGFEWEGDFVAKARRTT